jgi:hypothetical protein
VPATLRRHGIRRWWRTYHPTSINLLQTQPGGGVGSVVGGAVVGGLLLGGVGAVVGGLAGGKAGRVTFVVETAEGQTLTCQCKPAQFAGVHVAISTMIERFRAQGIPRGSGCLRVLGWTALVVLGLMVLLPLLAAIF